MAMRISVGLAAALAAAVAMSWGATAGAPAIASAQEAGSISGLAIDDENGNGVIDAGEPGLAGWEVATAGTPTRTAQVAADGGYAFEGLAPGTYTVTLVDVVGSAGPTPLWIPTLPNADLSYDVTLAAGEDIKNIDFAIQLSDEAAVLYATFMINAQWVPEGMVVQALIGDTVCDEYTIGVGPSSGRVGPPFLTFTPLNTVFLVVPSAREREGCGTEGDSITFTIDGRPANETEPWYPGEHVGLTVTVGPPYARYSGTVRVDGQMIHGQLVRAYIGDTFCGGADGLMGDYWIIVPPAELSAGCGEEGAIVRFMVGAEEADQIAQWGVGSHELNLTAPTPKPSPTPSATPTVTPTPSPSPLPALSPAATPARVPDVGTGGAASSEGGAGWWPFALAAAVAAALSGGGCGGGTLWRRLWRRHSLAAVSCSGREGPGAALDDELLLVVAEDLSHDAADLAQGAVGVDGVQDGGHQVVGASAGLPQGL